MLANPLESIRGPESSSKRCALPPSPGTPDAFHAEKNKAKMNFKLILKAE